MPSDWDGTLAEIAAHLRGESIALFAGAPNAQTPHLLSISEMDPTAWAKFVEYYAAINPMMKLCEERLDPGETWFAHSVISDADLEQTEFYADFFHPNNMHHSVGMRLQTEGLPLANISCQRTKAAGPFGVEADVILQTLRPHLLRALSLRMHLGAMEAQKHGLESALDVYDHAVIGIDATGCIALCSNLAQAVLTTAYGLSIQNMRLVCRHPADNERLLQLVRNAISLATIYSSQHDCGSGKTLPGRTVSGCRSQNQAGNGNSMLLRQAGNSSELRITVLPHRRALPGQSLQLAALIFFSESDTAPRSRGGLLASLYGLTPTESRIADLLARGLDTTEIAARLRLTKETSRFYIKRILAKTGTRRQHDLVRLILSLPAE